MLFVQHRGKQPLRVKARNLLCYFANKELGMSTVGLARILSIGQSAISRSVQRGEKIAEAVDFAHQFLVIMKSCPQKQGILLVILNLFAVKLDN